MGTRARSFGRLWHVRLWVQRFAFVLLLAASFALVALGRVESPWAGRLRSGLRSVHHPAGRLHDLRGLLRKHRRDLRARGMCSQCYLVWLGRRWSVPNVFQCHWRFQCRAVRRADTNERIVFPRPLLLHRYPLTVPLEEPNVVVACLARDDRSCC